MELGKIQSLKVDRKKDFGVYLTDGNGEDVLLPMKEVPEGCEVGSEIEVFVYRDSKDRLIATTRRPKILVGEVGRLLVKSTTGIGAFLDIGLERDVLLPFKETVNKVKEGDEILVYLYVDKSNRLAASDTSQFLFFGGTKSENIFDNTYCHTRYITCRLGCTILLRKKNGDKTSRVPGRYGSCQTNCFYAYYR